MLRHTALWSASPAVNVTVVAMNVNDFGGGGASEGEMKGGVCLFDLPPETESPISVSINE